MARAIFFPGLRSQARRPRTAVVSAARCDVLRTGRSRAGESGSDSRRPGRAPTWRRLSPGTCALATFSRRDKDLRSTGISRSILKLNHIRGIHAAVVSLSPSRPNGWVIDVERTLCCSGCHGSPRSHPLRFGRVGGSCSQEENRVHPNMPERRVEVWNVLVCRL
jgi:hypothetical protein